MTHLLTSITTTTNSKVDLDETMPTITRDYYRNEMTPYLWSSSPPLSSSTYSSSSNNMKTTSTSTNNNVTTSKATRTTTTTASTNVTMLHMDTLRQRQNPRYTPIALPTLSKRYRRRAAKPLPFPIGLEISVPCPKGTNSSNITSRVEHTRHHRHQRNGYGDRGGVDMMPMPLAQRAVPIDNNIMGQMEAELRQQQQQIDIIDDNFLDSSTLHTNETCSRVAGEDCHDLSSYAEEEEEERRIAKNSEDSSSSSSSASSSLSSITLVRRCWIGTTIQVNKRTIGEEEDDDGISAITTPRRYMDKVNNNSSNNNNNNGNADEKLVKNSSNTSSPATIPKRHAAIKHRSHLNASSFLNSTSPQQQQSQIPTKRLPPKKRNLVWV